MGNRRVLVLWDVDHTLIETRGVGRVAFSAAFAKVTGCHPEKIAVVTGRTELDIFAETVKMNGIPLTDGLFDRFTAALTGEYRTHINQLRQQGRALPGASQSLALLGDQSDIVQSILTGNIQPVAKIKLLAFGLGQHVDFQAGAYGTDNRDRARLVPLAQARAGARYHATYTTHSTVLIGDSLADIEAARDGGAKVIAVGTGKSSAAQLHDADAVFPDLQDAAALLGAIRKLTDAREHDVSTT